MRPKHLGRESDRRRARLLGQVNERMRDVTEGPDGALYLLADNPKGRVKVVPKK